MVFNLSEYSYTLPPQLIANAPTDPRDGCKLLVLDRMSGQLKHHIFYELEDLLTSHDVLVLNQSKVFPARLYGHKTTAAK